MQFLQFCEYLNLKAFKIWIWTHLDTTFVRKSHITKLTLWRHTIQLVLGGRFFERIRRVNVDNLDEKVLAIDTSLRHFLPAKIQRTKNPSQSRSSIISHHQTLFIRGRIKIKIDLLVDPALLLQ
jgi:hypothetical protein